MYGAPLDSRAPPLTFAAARERDSGRAGGAREELAKAISLSSEFVTAERGKEAAPPSFSRPELTIPD